MPTRILSANKFTKLLYAGPERRDIQIRFESSGPVNIYGVSEALFEVFKTERKYDLFRFLAKVKLDKTIAIKAAFGEDWYLILENKSDVPVAIHYEVFDV